MAHLHQMLLEVAFVVRAHRWWMSWNLMLAAVPAVLAAVLFAAPHRRRAGWWVGVAAFVVTLPNAPYVVTDLVHLPNSVALASSGRVVVGVVLPLYAAFVAAGYLAYLLCTELVLHEVRTVRPAARRWVVEGSLHVLCTVGILVGRIARLNSWDTITDPTNTAEQVFQTLTWRWAPIAFVLVLVAVWITHLVVRTLVLAVTTAGRDAWRNLQPAVAA